MNKQNSHVVAGFVLVFLALCAIGAAMVALSDKAHASTGDKKQPIEFLNCLPDGTRWKGNWEGDTQCPTARDWQRLNACAQYMPQYEGTVEDVIRCAAIGKGIARFESASGTSRVAIKQKNSYGIMAFPKKGGRYLKTYKTTALCDLDYARIWWKFYRTTKIKDLALIWTGEPWIAAKYAKAVKSWYPEYHKMYSDMAVTK
jgi:hypothetical protein